MRRGRGGARGRGQVEESHSPPHPQRQCLELLPQELCGHGHEVAGAREQRPLRQPDDQRGVAQRWAPRPGCSHSWAPRPARPAQSWGWFPSVAGRTSTLAGRVTLRTLAEGAAQARPDRAGRLAPGPPAVGSFGRRNGVAAGGRQSRTQLGCCLPEPASKSHQGKRRAPAAARPETHGCPTLPCRVLPEGSGGQRALHVDRAVRASRPHTDSNYLRGPELAALPGWLARRRLALVFSCGQGAGGAAPGGLRVWTLLIYAYLSWEGVEGGSPCPPSPPSARPPSPCAGHGPALSRLPPPLLQAWASSPGEAEWTWLPACPQPAPLEVANVAAVPAPLSFLFM